MEINGIAHVMLTVSSLDTQGLGLLELTPLLMAGGMLYCMGRRLEMNRVPGDGLLANAEQG